MGHVHDPFVERELAAFAAGADFLEYAAHARLDGIEGFGGEAVPEREGDGVVGGEVGEGGFDAAAGAG